MRIAVLLAALLGLSTTPFPSAAYPPVGKEKEKTDPRETVEGTIGEMIRLLEAKEYKKLIETFAISADLDRMKKLDGGIDKLAEEFGKAKGEKLLAVLKSIKDKKPVMEDDGKKASFEPKEGERKITFVKVEKFWYVKD